MQNACPYYASYFAAVLALLCSCVPPASSPAASDRMFSSPAVSRQAFSPLENHPTEPTSTININPDFNQKSSF